MGVGGGVPATNYHRRTLARLRSCTPLPLWPSDGQSPKTHLGLPLLAPASHTASSPPPHAFRWPPPRATASARADTHDAIGPMRQPDAIPRLDIDNPLDPVTSSPGGPPLLRIRRPSRPSQRQPASSSRACPSAGLLAVLHPAARTRPSLSRRRADGASLSVLSSPSRMHDPEPCVVWSRNSLCVISTPSAIRLSARYQISPCSRRPWLVAASLGMSTRRKRLPCHISLLQRQPVLLVRPFSALTEKLWVIAPSETLGRTLVGTQGKGSAMHPIPSSIRRLFSASTDTPLPSKDPRLLRPLLVPCPSNAVSAACGGPQDTCTGVLAAGHI